MSFAHQNSINKGVALLGWVVDSQFARIRKLNGFARIRSAFAQPQLRIRQPSFWPTFTAHRDPTTTRPDDDDHQTIGYLLDVELNRVKVPCIVHVVGACHVAGVVDATGMPRDILEAVGWGSHVVENCRRGGGS